MIICSLSKFSVIFVQKNLVFVTKSVHYCPATKKSMERMYTDLTSLEAYPSSGAYPVKDEEGNPLETEYGLLFVLNLLCSSLIV